MIFFIDENTNTHTYHDGMLEMVFLHTVFRYHVTVYVYFVVHTAQSIDFSFGAKGRNRLSQLEYSLRIIHKLNNKGFIGG